MTATLVKIVEKKQYLICHILVRFIACLSISISNFYITHEAACESLHNLDFCSQYLTTCCNVWTLYTTILSSILKFITALIFILHVFSFFSWTPSLLHKFFTIVSQYTLVILLYQKYKSVYYLIIFLSNN